MSLNVLIVDDSAVMRAMVAKVLRATGLPIGQALEASNGREGLEVLEDHWVDVVFADINMPVMTGEEMIEAIRSKSAWSELPIVVISTEGSKARIEYLQSKGAKFVHKPFTPELIRDVVTDLTGICHEQHVG